MKKQKNREILSIQNKTFTPVLFNKWFQALYADKEQNLVDALGAVSLNSFIYYDGFRLRSSPHFL